MGVPMSTARPEINDLSLLSLLAAHELERLERREESDGEYLSALRNYLAKQVGPARDDIKNLAPSTLQLYRRAIHDATSVDPPDFPTLVSQLDLLLDQLRLASEEAHQKERKKPADLKQLLLFIISLHGQLLAQKKRAATARASNKYRV